MNKNIKYIKTLGVSFFLVFFVGYTKSENPCQVMVPSSGSEDWGIGGYLIPENFSVKVYSEDSNKVFGILSAKSSFLKMKTKDGKNFTIKMDDLTFLGHPQNGILKVKQCFNPKYERVLWQTHNEVLYIDKSEVKNAGCNFSKYKDILIGYTIKAENPLKIGINVQKSCLNLRANPNESGLKILCALGNDWEKDFETVIEIIEVKENWAKVNYYELHPATDFPNNDEDCYSVIKNKKIGWVKAISDKGFPNIWFAVSGY